MAGRKPAPIDIEELEKLASMQCTDEEMAAWFGISRETLVRRKKGAIRDAIERGKAKGRASLRRAQFQTALKGSATMQIWLGKQLLGQKDILTTEHAGEITVNDSAAREELLSRIAGLATKRGTTISDTRPN